MGILHKIKLSAMYLIELVNIRNCRKVEIKKFEDPRRRKIYEKIEMTDEQKEQIDELYLKNYGEKIPYTWHRHYTAFTGNFDPCYFPELLFIPEFERFMNYHSEYAAVFQDKNYLPMIANYAGIKTPESVLSRMEGIYLIEGERCSEGCAIKNLNSYKGLLFAKPSIDSCSGRGCRILDVENGIDKKSGEPLKKVFADLGNNFVIQKCLCCHSSISAIYSGSVNTFRVITYRWKDEFKIMPIIMRIGRGGNYLDNAHAGGMFIAVERDGTLHRTAFTEFGSEFTEHPDTHLKFEGYKIEHFEKVVSAALRMHSAMPQIGCVNWDFTIDETGEPVLIEANINGGSIWMAEIAHGKGCFGENTPEVLRWIRKIKLLKPHKREQYAYGKGAE